MAAADLVQARQAAGKQACSARVIAAGMGQQAFGQWQGDLGPDGATEVRGLAAAFDQGGEQQVRFELVGTRQAVQVLQAEERLHGVAPAQLQIGRQRLPARSDVDSGDLQAGQQRDRTDLVLGILWQDPPHVPVVDLQHPRLVAAGQVEQRQVPPVVGVHEGVQAFPVPADLLQEGDAFLDPACGEHHVGQGVLGPGLVGLDRQGLARAGFGLFQQVALLVGEGQHGVALGNLRGRGDGLEGDAQQGRPVAAVEFDVLGQLGGEQVAGIGVEKLLAQAQDPVQVIVDPGVQQSQVERGPGVGRGDRSGALPVFPGQQRAFGRFAEHQQDPGQGVAQCRLRMAIGGGQDGFGARMVADETADEVVQSLASMLVVGVEGVA
ncbi:hypothetical protein CSV86_010825 [Pseudomonas putida CSV86]|uniref:Uncharacterized protein n=1 Tax=Pseudomonas bharatica CSV86 TaxID=1005395 RepID=A0A7K4EDG4_9PSED|nr:hypothetical protein [Pseudomonas bharatica]NNJ15693.1 hypothetical protein [Pseudomonas bharatica CSV86]